MNDYQLDPNICPSSLNEKDEPMIEGETDHKWDTTTEPITCSECGATREPNTRGRALSTMSDLIDYYLDVDVDKENELEVIEMQRYIRDNLK